MTPYEIDLLIGFHCRANWQDGVNLDAPILEETLLKFMGAQLIQGPIYTAGPALDCYMQALMAVPTPVQVWVIPEE